jgi:hypothetical protein
MKCLICNIEKEIEEGKNVCKDCREAEYIIYSEVSYFIKRWYIAKVKKISYKTISVISIPNFPIFNSYIKKENVVLITNLKTALNFIYKYSELYKEFQKQRDIMKKEFYINIQNLLK